MDYKTVALENLVNKLDIIYDGYDKLYSMNDRDAEMIKELTNITIQLAALIEVITRDNFIHPGYALEKLILWNIKLNGLKIILKVN